MISIHSSEAMPQRNARLVTVDRAAGMGDTVVIDYAGFTQDGEQFDGGTAEGHRLKLGSTNSFRI